MCICLLKIPTGQVVHDHYNCWQTYETIHWFLREMWLPEATTSNTPYKPEQQRKKDRYKESSHLSPVSLSSSLVVQSFLQTSENHRISSPIFISHLFFVHRIAPAPSQPTYAQSTWTFFRIATTKMVTIVMIITILVYCYEGQRERISEPRFKPTRTTSLQGAPYQ